MRFRNFFVGLKYMLALLAVFLVGLTVTLFIGLPRVVNWLADLVGTGAESPVHWAPAIIIDLILILLAIIWIWLPWEQYRVAQRAQGLVVRRGQGRAFIDTESVRQQVYAAVLKIADVQRVEVTIANDLGRALVTLNILADNGINGPKKKQEVSREVKKVVEDQLGVKLASEPTINISLTPLTSIVGEVPQVAKSPSPSSPRTFATPEPQPRPPAANTAPAAAPVVVAPPPPEAEPISGPARQPEPEPVKDIEPVSTIVVQQPGPENPLEAPPQALTGTDTAVSAVSPRPFIRRPFTPPGGSTTLPDLPPIPPRQEPPSPDTRAEVIPVNPPGMADENQPDPGVPADDDSNQQLLQDQQDQPNQSAENLS